MNVMKSMENLTPKQAEVLLLSVIVARSTSFMFSKMTLQTMSAFSLLGTRFLLAFAILCVLCCGKLRQLRWRTVARGALIGAIYFGVMSLEMAGLKTTGTGETSFLENSAIVIVPLLNAALLRKIPSAAVIGSSAAALLGVGFLTLGGGVQGFSQGKVMCLLAAVAYSVGIIATDRLTRKEDPLLLGVLQVGFMGFFSFLAALFTGTWRLPDTPREWGIVVVLAVVCTVFGFTLQPVAQSKTDVEKAGLFCAANPVSATVLGAVFLHEQLYPQSYAGIALVLASILLPKLWPLRRRTAPHMA